MGGLRIGKNGEDYVWGKGGELSVRKRLGIWLGKRGRVKGRKMGEGYGRKGGSLRVEKKG